MTTTTAVQEVKNEPKIVIYRKSIHFDEDPCNISLECARHSISAWKINVDKAIENLLAGKEVRTSNHRFYIETL